LGTYPEVDKKPKIPYHGIGDEHLLFDLIYNPEETAFLKKGKQYGAKTVNGLKMLELQAEKAWDIWNS
jgi:shikimate dehydrogenase